MKVNDLPPGWTKSKIGAVYYFIGGGTPSKANSIFWNGKIPWASIKDISKVEELQSTQDSITELGLHNSAANLAQVDDVIIGTRMLPGKPVLSKIVTAINQDLKIVKTHLPILPKFTYYLFRNLENDFVSRSAGTTVKGIRIEAANDIPIPLPPLAEQKRIVAKLDAAFAHLEKIKVSLARIPGLLKRFREAVLTQAVTGKLTEEWREGKELNVLIDIRAIEETLAKEKKWKKVDVTANGKCPKGWHFTAIGNIAIVSNGSTPSRSIEDYWNGNIPWIGSSLVQNNRIRNSKENITEKGFQNSSTKILSKGTVLLAMIGEGKTRAQSAILDIEATINQNIAAIEIDHGRILPEFLQYFLIANYEKHRRVGNGTGPQALNCQKVRELDFIFPALSEQQKICRLVESFFSTADAIESQYHTLKQKIDALPQALLTKAFRGELVPQDPDDEPAAVLLEKIRKEMEKLGKKGRNQGVLDFVER